MENTKTRLYHNNQKVLFDSWFFSRHSGSPFCFSSYSFIVLFLNKNSAALLFKITEKEGGWFVVVVVSVIVSSAVAEIETVVAILRVIS